MTAFVLLLVCLLLGVGAARYAQPPIGLAQAINWWVINIALPALILELIPTLHFDPHLWLLIVSQWLVFAGAFVLLRAIGRRSGWSDGRIGALTLVCGLGNTSFLGYPMIAALRGQDGLALAVVADQLGCFIMLALGGVIVAVIYGGATAHPREIARRVLLFPAFLALLAGVVIGLLGGWPAMAGDILHRIGQTLTPLALFSVGLRLRLHLTRDQIVPAAIGLSWKLLLAPLLVFALGYVCGAQGLLLTVAVLQAGMAPMISAAILADQHHLEPPLANTVLGLGILLSLATVPLTNLLL
ncbi:MAG: AEC family transporter [Nevskiaceae bacterium]|nr:MAG: AEC family transporter [Nevskiaceae bacterium]